MPRRPHNGPTRLISDERLYLFNEGSELRLWEVLGAHPDAGGTQFAVWAPNASRVAVLGDFNAWTGGDAELIPQGDSGVLAGYVPGVGPGALYKYRVWSGDSAVDHADPVGFLHETPPKTASVVWPLQYAWHDEAWMAERGRRSGLDAPETVYEMHVGSWRRPRDGRPYLNYREMAEPLAEYLQALRFTHVELMPIMEHPFYGSWGYQTTGYFAPTSRYGSPDDLMFLIDTLHQADIGVILDWVPSHFPGDQHALAQFDGTHLYEHADPRQGVHPDWNSLIFNYSRHEVQSFLTSSGLFWLDRYHADGLRVDAVASMLYLDYSRKPGEWIPNADGSRENWEAIRFLQHLNRAAYARYPGVQTYAEESTAWSGVSRPTDQGGLGFGYKWDMGWMHDTLQFLQRDPIHRSHHYDALTFRSVYAWSENFVLPLSHDEVVYGKGSLLSRMPGDEWQQRANLRLLLALQATMPGKKLLFMGGEWGQWEEWSHEAELAWEEAEEEPHAGIRRLVADLNRLYLAEPALHVLDASPEGFAWVGGELRSQTLYAFRREAAPAPSILVAVNGTPVPRERVWLSGVAEGHWDEVLNSDAARYGGANIGNLGSCETKVVNGAARLPVTFPPLGVVVLRLART